MAKITCVGQIGSFIQYHFKTLRAPETAASLSCGQGAGSEGRPKRPSPAKTCTVHADLSYPLGRAPETDHWGSFQKVRPAPSLDVSLGPIFQLLTPLNADQSHTPTRHCAPQMQGVGSSTGKHGERCPGKPQSIWEHAMGEEVPPSVF